MMTNLLLDITSATIDWSRAQFALTAIYHWLFVPLTLGLAVIMGIAETCYYRTNKPFWKHVTRFWQKLFGVNFAMGVATGIILEFEFGTNWSNYSWFVGDVFGAPLAIEGILAFFMESTFVAVMFFGWDKVSRGFHLASTWLTGLGATISAWWILVANAWMQYPVGQEFNPDTMRFEMTSFMDVALSPFAINKFTHTVTSSWIIGATFVVAVSCWYLLKKRETQLAKASIKMGAGVGLIATLLAAMTGDNSAYQVAQVQPMKLAAMEALYNGGNGESLTAIAAVHPFRQPDYENEQEPAMRIAIPNMLSFLATRTADGYVPGVNDIIKGYEGERPAPYPQGEYEILRIWLHQGRQRTGTEHPDLLLRLPPDGGNRLPAHSLLRPQPLPRLQEGNRPIPMVPHFRHHHDSAGLHRLRIGLDSSRNRSPALDHPRPAASKCRHLRHRSRQRGHHLLHLPGTLHHHACRGNQHPGEAD